MSFFKVAEIDIIWFFIELGKAVGIGVIIFLVYAMIFGDNK